MPSTTLKSCVQGLDPATRLGVAVSGGGDSVAALLLAVEVLGAQRVEAATVDHGLRADAADEARGVARLCERLGVRHEVLVWGRDEGRDEGLDEGLDRGRAGQGNLMDAARRARQRLLGRWARSRGLAAVVLAHTLDDQAETVLLRLARGSGVDGLSGMAPIRRAQGVDWLRPFLTVTRAALRAELVARNIGWIEDPTNSDARFARTRARAALGALAEIGVDAAGLAATAARMARARSALDEQVELAYARLAREDRGTTSLDVAVLELSEEIRDRVLSGLIRAMACAPYRPRLAALHRVIAALARDRGAATLGGVALRRTGAEVRVWREARAVARLRSPVADLWDGRWRATGPDMPGAEIAAMGQDGLAQLSRQARMGLHPHWRETGLDAAMLAGLPGIWKDGVLIAAPLVDWPQEWRLDARPLAAGLCHSGEFD